MSWTVDTADAASALRMLPTGCVDLTVTSPPYDRMRDYNDAAWSERIWKAILRELFRVTATGGVVVWIVGDATIGGSETGTSFRQALFAQQLGFNIHDTMIYEKDNPPPVGGDNRYYQSFEYAFVFSRGAPKTFNELTRPRRDKWDEKRTHRIRAVNRQADGTFLKKKRIEINTAPIKRSNIWRYTVGGGISVENGTGHPAGAPEKLVNDHILTWSNEGDLVLDPMMGSGTTGAAAVAQGRDFYGIDIEESYVKAAADRIEGATMIPPSSEGAPWEPST